MGLLLATRVKDGHKTTDLVYCCTSQLRTSINFEYD
jgi:hypothetical protein